MKNIYLIGICLSALLAPFLLVAQVTHTDAFPNISFNLPVELIEPGDGTDRFFVVEQAGKIKVFPRRENVQASEVSTFLDIESKVRFSNGLELGLLGLAFHPNYETNGFFYVYYTADSPVSRSGARMILSRFSVNPNNPNIANSTERIIFQVDKNQNNSNHNGGKIGFGPNGYLYVSYGDGGGGNDPQRNAQNINNVFGSICRIDVDLDGNNPVETNPDLPNGNYEIPSDNPFVGGAGLDEIFAFGLRNTWRFAFDEPTGRMWGGDVGQNAFEEINIIEKGFNYGWNRFEAESVANNTPAIPNAVPPILFYPQTSGDRSITGGYVYRGAEITSLNPLINSNYIFGDYVSGRVWVLNYDPITGNSSKTLLFKTNGLFVASFGVDKNGEMYFLDYGRAAKIYKLIDGVSPPQGNTIDGVGQWNTLGSGIPNGEVKAIAVDGNGNVYHGGNFSQAGSVSAQNIAVYNEASGWDNLGSGANGTVNTVKIAPNGLVYIGGNFTQVGGVLARGIAVWNGTNWSAVGNSATAIEGIVSALEIDGQGKVYAAGIFENLNGNLVRNIAVWDGSTWSGLRDTTTNQSGTNNEIRSLTISDANILYAGGNFNEAGGVTANRIAAWNPSNSRWSGLGTGTSGFVEAIVTNGSDVFAGGNFAIAGGQTVNRLAKWDTNTSTWTAVGNGVSNNVQALLHDGTNLYAAGTFDIASLNEGNFIVQNIACWNATDGWNALGTNTEVGVDVKINTISFGADTVGKIYAAGNFTKAGTRNTMNTAVWTSDSTTLNVDDNGELKLSDILVYPNPTSGEVTTNKQANWVLHDTLGKVIQKGTGTKLNLSEEASGIYYLKLDNSKTFTIIKK